MRLLMIEDEQVLGANLKKILELKGFAVDWVSEGDKALTRATLYHTDYDVIVLDLTLPGLDGMSLTKKVREEGIKTPIIILTGKNETHTKVELLNAGADDYVVKPFSSEELVARIGSVARRPQTQTPVVHTVGSITVDTATHKVFLDGEEISLTLKEYALLECFLRRPGEVFTREELSNHVWDFNSMTWSNVLDVHMKNLRKKLEHGPSSPRFETVRGVGYRFIA
ncbi:hypothetical protein A2419_02925 [Candidatus Adlerbacteria bacterium RIFOXYC1_FULL_48_26]|uniref:DNA-binding response regulator n=1 Tax=Candidatus Adlerbacteria bacterium RIFOXYC1_FULL_48_26 TaxID=1797247 RepID=A0A1F4Y5P5_9BACT|nr:MAG: hypothetical protein A2419_02925 [Candidatus Adlerbacteria bacterium RIFOXYC1_FULL_48_26]OGC93563.1 MAG: hypothetical protein A2389_00765 [Candidatus Adlerbacteria bacterium RIFOXYB1_FULL_48_10]